MRAADVEQRERKLQAPWAKVMGWPVGSRVRAQATGVACGRKEVQLVSGGLQGVAGPPGRALDSSTSTGVGTEHSHTRAELEATLQKSGE